MSYKYGQEVVEYYTQTYTDMDIIMGLETTPIPDNIWLIPGTLFFSPKMIHFFAQNGSTSQPFWVPPCKFEHTMFEIT